MEPRQWSDEKNELFLFRQNICVRAGAGSGKTAALVELNSRFLSSTTPLGDVDMEQILAITFTEKAAGEIKERIRSMIEEHLKNNDSGEVPRKWIKARKEMLRSNISTFHSFCTRILRENPLQAGLDTDFEIITETKSDELMEKSAEKTILDELRNKSSATSELLEITGFQILKDTLKNTLKSLKSSGENITALRQKLVDAVQTAELAYVNKKNELTELLREFADICEMLIAKKDKSVIIERYREIRDDYEKLFIIPGMEIDKSESSIGLLEKIDAFLSTKGKYKQELKETKDLLSGIIRDSLPGLIRFFTTLALQFHMVELIAEFDRNYSGSKRRHGFADFEDLLCITRDLLKNDKEIRKKYKNSFKVVLVDEFQDTNELQREIVYLIAEQEEQENDYLHPEDIKLQQRKLFIVGDAKQSIYQFRGADVSVFSKVIDDVRKKGGKEIVFRENFRTVRPILNMLNPFFEETMSKKDSNFEISFEPDDHLQAYRETADIQTPSVDILLSTGKSKSKRRKTEAAAIAKHILKLKNSLYIQGQDGTKKVSYGDIAILLRATTAVDYYTEELRNLNIPYTLLNGKGFYQTQEIRDLRSCLSFICGIEEDLSLLAILRSPLCGITDNSVALMAMDCASLTESFFNSKNNGISVYGRQEANKIESFRNKISRLRKFKDILPVSELIKKIIDTFDLTAVYLGIFQGALKTANIKKLIQKAVELQESEPLSVAEFVRFIENQQSDKEPEAQMDAGDSDTVKIMSIHKSKGLEFPIVILPDIDRNIKTSSDHNIYSSRSKGIALRSRDSKGNLKDTFLSSNIREEHRARESAESRRLLYVAMTRARDHMVILLPIEKTSEKRTEDKDGEKNWSEQFLEFFNKEKIEDFYFNSDEENCVYDYKKISADKRQYEFKVQFIRSETCQTNVTGNPECDGIAASKNNETVIKIIESANTNINTVIPVSQILNVTPTNIVTYDICKRKYLYDTFRGSGEGLYRITKNVPSGRPNQEMGWAAHYILERIDFDEAGKQPRKHIARIIRQLKAENPFIPEKTVRWAAAATERFLKTPTRLKHLFRQGSTYLKEHEIYFSLFEDKKIYMNGIMDLIVTTSDGKIAVLDYKYGPPGKEKPLRYEKQLYCYLMGMEKIYDAGDLESYIVFMEADRTSVHKINTAKLREFETGIKETILDIYGKIASPKEQEWDKTKNPNLCKKIKCPYIKRCYGALV